MNKIPSEIAVGSDLEVFLFSNELKKIVPCVGILDGTKDKPWTPPGFQTGFAIQEDNVMVEYNIPPANSGPLFVQYIQEGKHMVLQELSKRYGAQYSLYTRKSDHKFQARDLQSDQAKLIGCEPDFDAYEGGKMRYDPPKPGLHRACGGHIHLGGDFKCPDFVAALFAELMIGVRGGVHSTPDGERAKWYGKPGIYRPKPYGIEYRTPHNGWAMSSTMLERVGAYGIHCAKYLTESSANVLQNHFRQVPWLKVREYMLMDKSRDAAGTLHRVIMRTAQKVGVPV
jgi:hypothetical protein